MIFVCLGTQKFQFNRLLKWIDQLIDEKVITETVFAQIGFSDYIPKNYDYIDFLCHDEFVKRIEECDLFITHGGVGSIQEGRQFDKKIIVVPRKAEFNEHIDNHQLEIAKKYDEMNLILKCEEYEELKSKLVNKEYENIGKKTHIKKNELLLNYLFDYIAKEKENNGKHN